MHKDDEYKIFCKDNRSDHETPIPIGMCPILSVMISHKDESDLFPDYILPKMTLPVRIMGGFVIQSLN